MLLVVGNTTLDTALQVDRLPLPGETVLAGGRADGLGGKGANQAVTAVRCGVPVVFVSAVGSDRAGDRLLATLAGEGIDPDRILRKDGPTDRSFIAVSRDGENAIISTHAAAAAISTGDVDPALAFLGPDDTVLIQGNLSLAVTEHCLRSARDVGARTLINAAPIQFAYDGLWPATDIAILNAVETAALSGDADPQAGGQRLRASGVGTVIVTLGADGAVIVGTDIQQVSSPRVAAVDTTGAGDVFCGVLAAMIAERAPLAPSVERATAAASLCVTRPGAFAAIPTRAELA